MGAFDVERFETVHDGYRFLCQCPGRPRNRPSPGNIRGEVRAPDRDQGQIRPAEPVPSKCEHQADLKFQRPESLRASRPAGVTLGQGAGTGRREWAAKELCIESRRAWRDMWLYELERGA